MVETAQDEITFTQSGQRYVLGRGVDYVGIWDREHPDAPAYRFPNDEEGNRAALEEFGRLERGFETIGASTLPPPTAPPPPPPPAAAYPVARPSGVTSAANLLFAVGIIGGLLSLLGLLGATLIAGRIEGLEGGSIAIGTMVVVFLILVVLDVLQIVAGARVMKLRRSGRTMGLVATSISVGLWVLILIGTLAQGATNPIALMVALFTIGGGIAIIVLLGANRAAFTR